MSGVKKKNRNGKTLYDVTSSKIRGESESEGAVSLETLSLLAKSHPLIPVPYELQYENERLVVAFEGIDDVIYKLESTHTGVWPHSPYSLMGDLSKSEYPILLAESLKPLWSQAASLIKKGVYMDNKEKKKFNLDHAMTDSKDREETEEESAGIIEAEDDDNILKPKMNVMVKALARIAELTERIDTLQKKK